MDTIETMRLFVHAARSENFSQTGRQLGLAPSSVSRQIGALEDALGVRLLNRTTRKVHLTEAGSLYLERAARILADVDETNRAITELDSAPQGTLRVTAPVVFGQEHIAPVLPGFLHTYPQVHVELFASDQLVDLVQDGFDVGIRVGALEHSSLAARKLAPMCRVICASPQYLDLHGEPQAPKDLSHHNCLIFRFFAATSLWRAGARSWVLQDEGGQQSEVMVKGTLQANNAGVLVEAALQGLGLVLLPDWMVGGHLATGRLRPVLTRYRVSPSAIESAIYAVFPTRRHLSPKVRVFVDFLAAHFEHDPRFGRRDPASAVGPGQKKGRDESRPNQEEEYP